ncbi:P1 family peptidase [Oceaniglobus indicus]|uniref:P1 family peptidase n=1 Tax=Oceaniglobus indicus TaxID=2047749 RepID=UPI000C1A3B29|nr:P1 family peptidase [Oceaniglobus indicus]
MSGTDRPRDRAAARGLAVGTLPSGPLDAITDVTGVMVGHCTLNEGARTRTGATAILPHDGNLFARKVPAALDVLNGFGKFVGATQIDELGVIETPILLTNTLATGRAIDALIAHTLDHPDNARVTSINAVVGETNDSRLNDIRAPRPTVAEMRAALDAAKPGPVAEGAVGAGTGTVAFGLKGGIGTSSRVVDGFTVGVLVQSNFGGDLRIDGRPVSQGADADGSIVIICATDAPLDARRLKRLARRCFGGLARTGAALSHGSGDYALAFSTAKEGALLDDAACSPLFVAAMDTTQQAILNSLLMAGPMDGYDAGKDRPSHVPALVVP